jgi:hypothetical protein
VPGATASGGVVSGNLASRGIHPTGTNLGAGAADGIAAGGLTGSVAGSLAAGVPSGATGLAEPFVAETAGALVALGVADESPLARILTLDEAMKTHIQRALIATRGRIEGRQGAAAILGINPHTLRARMRKLGLEWSRFRD